MADFDPHQLDLLEDALEGLEDIDDLESLELSPELTGRLAEYQDVLALCRDVFPIEQPRDAVLADVLAEAQAVSRRPKLRDAGPGSGGWRQFWDRWRGTLVPGLALAGTAAAVLLLLEPEQLSSSTARLADEQHAEQSSKSDELPRNETDTTPSEPAGEANKHAKQDASEDGDETPTPSTSGQEPISDPIEVSKPATGAKKTQRPAKEPAPAIAPTPKPEPLSKDETWKTLERADTNRRKGDCEQARPRYEQVIAASSDAYAIARARAGVGLCLEQDRRSSEADAWYSQARSDSSSIDSWIDAERDEQPLPGEVKNRKNMPAPDSL